MDPLQTHTGKNVLIVGATRGLGKEVAKKYHEAGHNVSGTARSETPDDSLGIRWITGVDVAEAQGGTTIVSGLRSEKQDIVIISAGYFPKESLDEPDFDKEVFTYKVCAIGPVFVVHSLWKAGLLKEGSKVILISSEGGSIALRHESEGGGNFAHHGSKAALNMVGKLLSFDLRDAGVAVGLVHPAFMRTEMTAGVGFDKFWDEGGAVTPDESAKSLVDFIATFDMSKTGTYWAPRGAGDIGTAEAVLGPKDELPTPLQLPW